MYFFYDNTGAPIAFWYFPDGGSRVTGYYFTNQQGDVVRIEDPDGNVLASYSYDAWGKAYKSSGSMRNINPLRFRGYYYDTETGFYYLQSRYYDPVVSRFINADSYASTGQGFLGYNMFAYCGNNPVSRVDADGNKYTMVNDNVFGGGGAGLIGIFGLWALAQSAQNVKSQPLAKATTDKPPEEKSKTYYHVTTAGNAAAIIASGQLRGSGWEGGYVFVWEKYPNEQAIKNSGANYGQGKSGVIISIETNAAFEEDKGITDKKAKSCGPLRSVLIGPVSVQNTKIVGWY